MTDLNYLRQIDTVCDQFETDYRAGARPEIERCLGTVDPTHRSAFLQALVSLEIELRRHNGESVSPEDYERRFPQDVETVRSAFTDSRSILSSVKQSIAETKLHTPSAPRLPKPALTSLGRFRILASLGEGAFGAVYKAYDPQLDREVAVKVPRSDALPTDEDRQRFLREARAAANLQHPNICPVHEIGAVDGRDYIVMALLEGKLLSKVQKSGVQLNERQIATAVRKIALALEEAHKKGIIHRDLKPANIMINRRGEPVVMDFGLARRDKSGDIEISHSGQIMGTPAYMSPEQARGDGRGVGAASDIYSLGVIFYELLCGKRPFEGTVTQVIGKILHVDVEPPSKVRSEVDPRLEVICLKAVAKAPEERFASMKEFAAALEEYLKALNAPAVAAASAALATPPRSASTRRIAIVFALGFVAAAIVFGLTQFGGKGALVERERDPSPTDVAPPALPQPEPSQPAPPVDPPYAVAPFDTATAKDRQQRWAARYDERVEFKNNAGMEMRFIPPGKFRAGTEREEVERLQALTPVKWEKPGFAHEMPARDVEIKTPFYLAACETHVGAFREFVEEEKYLTEAETNGGGYSDHGGKMQRSTNFIWKAPAFAPSDFHPVVQVTLKDAEAFCRWLTKKDGRRYFLPTEEQWEFACRAGTTTRWWNGDDEKEVRKIAWIGAHAFSNTSDMKPVGSRPANPFGLHDLAGNVQEICRTAEGGLVTRGGRLWNSVYAYRSACRVIISPQDAWTYNGFRVAAEVKREER